MDALTREYELSYDQLINFAASDALEDMADAIADVQHDQANDARREAILEGSIDNTD